MLPHPLNNFETQSNIKMNLNFMAFFLRNNLSKIKNGAYIINLVQYESIETHCIALYVIGDNVTYFDSFGAKHIPKEIRNLI